MNENKCNRINKLRSALRQSIGNPGSAWREFRGAGIMLLCSCLIFQAVDSYIPTINSQEDQTDAAPEFVPQYTVETEPETERETETEAEAEQTYQPAPYLLNFAHQYPEESDSSYAEILIRELIQKDSRWYAEIYDMANIAPATIAARIGRSRSSVLGKYNPASKTQNSSDSSTWVVEHFKNVRVSFYNGDGTISSAVSNAQDILSMASVYAYYNGIDDLDELRSYVSQLWSASHSYSISMGDVYYCDGCVDANAASGSESKDSDLEGEDSFSEGRTINTEIMTSSGNSSVSEENAEENGLSVETVRAGSGTSSARTGGGSQTSQAAVTESTTRRPAAANASTGTDQSTRESTTSALQSLAETAESVYIEETKPKTTIVRVTTTAEETSAAKAATGEIKESETTTASALSLENAEADAAAQALPEDTVFRAAALSPETEGTDAETESLTEDRSFRAAALSMGGSSQTEETAQAEAETTASSQTVIVRKQETTEAAAAAQTTTAAAASTTPAADSPSKAAAQTAPTTEHTGTDEKSEDAKTDGTSATTAETKNTSSKKVCPGHIDLTITAKINTLGDKNSLYDLDRIGNRTAEIKTDAAEIETGSEEEKSWAGWTEQCRGYVAHINRQDWADFYGITIQLESTSSPLTDTEIESYMKLLPEDTSEIRKEIIRFALQSVGKIPYYWGGKASAKNYSGNNFGSIVIPDHKGRISRGLDCSGWIGWVYWTVTGNRLPAEGTSGLCTLGRQVKRQDLKPGDIIVTTGSSPHVIMFLGWAANGQIQCIHETGSANNVAVSTVTASWPYYRNLLD